MIKPQFDSLRGRLALPQTKFREAVFQILFCLDVGGAQENAILPLIMEELRITKKSAFKAYQHALAIHAKKEMIDGEIEGITKSYRIERIQRVEINILRLSVYELLFQKEIPPLVSIAEAIRLSHKFSTQESGKFINAILDAIMKRECGEEVDPEEVRETLLHLERKNEV